MKKYVKVEISRFCDLLSAEHTLLELEGAGVDNWSGIEECGELYPEYTEEYITKNYTVIEEDE